MIKSSFWSKAKAFTLFTAMVSFIIIGIGVVVVQHISNSEQNHSQVISALYRQQEMDAVKDLVRADVLQTFNVLYRGIFFQYYNNGNVINSQAYQDCLTNNSGDTGPCDDLLEQTNNNKYQSVGDLDHDIDWSEFKRQQIRELFFGETSTETDLKCSFANWVGDRILGQLNDYEGYFRGYQYLFRIYDYTLQKSAPEQDLRSLGNNFNIHGTILKTGMCTVFQNSYKELNNSKEFVKLLNCDGTNPNDCTNGSFYTNLYMTNMSYSTYLNLPRIFVYRSLDESEMDDAILPRNVLSLYVPLRLFGVLAFTRSTLLNDDLTKFENVWWGDNIDQINSCDYFDDKRIEDFTNVVGKPIQIQIDEFNKIFQENYVNTIVKSDNEFELKYDNIVSGNDYVNKHIIIHPTTSDLKPPEYIQKKVKDVRYEVSVIDKSPYYSFGNTGIIFGFWGSRTVVKDPKTEVLECTCEMDPNLGVSKCTGPGIRSMTQEEYSQFIAGSVH